MWQDILLGVANWVLVVALIPTVIDKTKKPTLLTSIVVGLALSAVGGTYATLGLWQGTVPTVLQAAMWLFLAYQRYHLDRRM